jgi:hypothetical protein
MGIVVAPSVRLCDNSASFPLYFLLHAVFKKSTPTIWLLKKKLMACWVELSGLPEVSDGGTAQGISRACWC